MKAAKTTRHAAVLATIATFAACAHSQAWTASGEAIAGLYESYTVTGHAMDVALDEKRITPEQYRKWAAFAHYFKPTLDLLADQWQNDQSAAHAEPELASLAAQLAGFTALTKNGGAGP